MAKKVDDEEMTETVDNAEEEAVEGEEKKFMRHFKKSLQDKDSVIKSNRHLLGTRVR